MTNRVTKRGLWWLVLVLFVAAALRVYGLASLTNHLHYDEATSGLEALSLLDNPRIIPFVTSSGGRESGWFYWIAPYMAAFGASTFALRLVPIFTGVLTTAACYVLGRELFGKRGGLGTAAAFAVLYWPVHINHIAFRLNLFGLWGTLALASLWIAHRRNRKRDWLVAGLWLGLTAYTYFAARTWLLLGALQCLWWLWRGQRRALLTLIVMGLIGLPIILFTLSNPMAAGGRIEHVAVNSLGEVLANIRAWFGAWLYQGDTLITHNLPGRPVLDLPLAILTFLGLSTLFTKQRKIGLWILGLGFFSLIPALFSQGAPQYLRGYGVTIALALIIGAGMVGLRRYGLKAQFVVIVLFFWAAGDTFVDYGQWLRIKRLEVSAEDEINDGLVHITNQYPEEEIVLVPGSNDLPVVDFRAREYGQQVFGHFDSRLCTVLADSGALYLHIIELHPQFELALRQWATVEVLERNELGYNILRGAPLSIDWNDALQFGEALLVKPLSITPEHPQLGDTINITLAIRPLQALPPTLNLMLHLYGTQTPYEGGELWAQGDRWLCPAHFSEAVLSDTFYIQTLTLPLPDSLPPDTYSLAIGVYDRESGEPLYLPDKATYAIQHTFSIPDIDR